MSVDFQLRGPRLYVAKKAKAPYVAVSEGHFARPQKMGWLVTTEKDFTVAVSCDAEFVRDVVLMSDEIKALRIEVARLREIIVDMEDVTGALQRVSPEMYAELTKEKEHDDSA